MTMKENRRALVRALALTSLLGAGCVSSMQNSPAIDALKGALDSTGLSKAPFVEASVEYPGPAQKWSGPAGFLLSLSARDAGDAKIKVQPALWNSTPENPAPSLGRGLASTANQVQVGGAGLPSEFVRERLAQLATAIEGDKTGFSGCLYPVKVRLVRADGGVLEKVGCRGRGAWTGAVSGFVSEFLTALTQPARAAALRKQITDSASNVASARKPAAQ